MISQTTTDQAQVQRLKNDITASLAPLAKEPVDLGSYFRVHLDIVFQVLHPIGLSYEMVNGNTLQRVTGHNLESLALRQKPEQEAAFQKATHLAVTNAKAVLIEPNVLPAEGLHGLQPADSPAPDELPVFNSTPYHHFFMPILVGAAAVGVLHTWFSPSDANGKEIRQTLLRHACGEIELYLKARRLGDVTAELTRLTTYSKLLEQLAGDLDLDSVTWNIVNYARESLACERVCVFVATNYEKSLRMSGEVKLDYDYDLYACSGLKKPHPRSEHAVILQGMAKKLTEMALDRTQRSAPTGPAREESKRAAADGGANGNGAATAVPKNPSASGDRPPPASEPEAPAARPGIRPAVPQIQLTLIRRDPSKIASRPDEVNDYFEVLPMNWATVLPLFDREARVCGIVLFEGVRPPENLETSFLHMRDLAISAGRSLGTSLFWTKQRSMRIAQKWISTRQSVLNTPARRWITKVILPIALVTGIMLYPAAYRVKGEANIIPAVQNTLPVLSSSTLVRVVVKEGQLVKKGEVLAIFDTKELELQLQQTLQEYQRAMIEADTSGRANETQMLTNRTQAAKAFAQVEKLRDDIEKSKLRAPFDGMVLGAQGLSNRIGQFFRIGEPALEVVEPRQWQVKVGLREQDISFMERFIGDRPIPAELKLAADPARLYPLQLRDRSQLSYGLDVNSGKYLFNVVLPLEMEATQGSLLKSGFSGRVSFDVIRRPIGYILFRDFGNFIRLRFL